MPINLLPYERDNFRSIIFAANTALRQNIIPRIKVRDVITDGYFQRNTGQGVYAGCGKILRFTNQPLRNGVLSVP